MKKGLLILLIALVAGVAAFCAARWHSASRHQHHSGVALDAMPELEWLRKDLNLSEDQYLKVRELHTVYRPKCVEMCRRIAEAHEKIEEIAKANNKLTLEYRAALREHADIHVECQEEMLNHLYTTAATLNKEQAERYLKTTLPFALDFTHSESGTIHAR